MPPIISKKQASPILDSNLVISPISSMTKDPPNLVIKARAGVGKTYTIIESIKRTLGLPSGKFSEQQELVSASISQGKRPKGILVCSFSNIIVNELRDRIPKGVGVDAKGLHSIGNYAVCKAFNLKRDSNSRDPNRRVPEIIAELLGKDLRELRKQKSLLVTSTRDLVAYCKQNLVSFPASMEDVAGWNAAYDRVDHMARYYDVDFGEYRDEVLGLIPRVLDRCKDVAKDGYIDFNDMIWLPVIMNLPLWRYDLVIVDEAQDLNICQQALSKMIAHRICYVGDDRQAIYAFAGADSKSLSRLYQELSSSQRGCVELGITETRRCGKAIVAEAQKYVPDFKAHEDNPTGEVRHELFPIQKIRTVHGTETVRLPDRDTYIPLVKAGDMILCRSNSPLVSQCLSFLKQGKKAYIRGRNIADSLISLVEKLQESSESITVFQTQLIDWRESQIAKENTERIPSESKIQSINDRVDCIQCFMEGSKSIDAIKTKIKTIFGAKECPRCKQLSDDKEYCEQCSIPLVMRKGIQFSSIHKAKGLEADTVFYITGFSPLLDKLQDWEIEQEDNLAYVAITRAKKCLVYVGQGEPKKKEEYLSEAEIAEKEPKTGFAEPKPPIINMPDANWYSPNWKSELRAAICGLDLPKEVRQGIERTIEDFIKEEV